MGETPAFEPCEHGATGLRLGLSYEARAQVAIWAEDAAAFEHYARLTAHEYRHGARCPLGSRYERLVNEAARSGFHAGVALSDFEPTTLQSSAFGGDDLATTLVRVMAGASDVQERARRALHLVCELRNARGGHLFVHTQQDLQLGASHGLPAPPALLSDLVREFLVREQERSETLTLMVTGELDDAAALSARVQVGSDHYELMLLSCVIAGEGKVAGVIALAPGEQQLRHPKQEQLLATIAGHLVAANDSDAAVTVAAQGRAR